MAIGDTFVVTNVDALGNILRQKYISNGGTPETWALQVSMTGGGSGGNAAAGPTGSAVPASADYLGYNSGGNLQGVSSSTPLPTQSDGVMDGVLLTPASVTSAIVIFTQDMLGYQGISVQILSPGTSTTIVYETSDDNTNWQQTTGLVSTTTGASGNSAASATVNAQSIQFPRRGRWFRARVSNYNGGTVTVVGSLLKSFVPVITLGGLTVVGNITAADGAALTATLKTWSLMSGYNGTTEDLMRTLPGGNGTGVGAALVGMFRTGYFPDTTAALAANATFTGTARDVTLANSVGYSQWNYFGASFFADQSGTAFVEGSIDSTTWTVMATAAVTASTTVDLNVRIRVRYYRVRYLNGGTINTVMRINSSFTAS